MTTTRPRLWSLVLTLSAAGLAACGGGAGGRMAPLSAKSPAPSEPSYGAAAPAEEAAGAESEAPAPPAAAPPGGYGGADISVGKAARGQAAEAAPSREEAIEPAPVRPQVRPGLGTEWGESRYSRVTSTPFARADATNPFATAQIYYNDRDGIQAMLETWGGSPSHRTSFLVSGGYLEVALRGGDGGFLSGMSAGGRDYVTGQAGDRYTIVIDNRTPARIEALVTVDGLDVIDGRPGAYGKRGYLLEAHGHLEIEGFRRSDAEVAAFRFGSVRDSYAGRKHGETRNVGVIGFAFFHESGDSPSFWSQPWRYDEANRRHQADPFPNRYATPPR